MDADVPSLDQLPATPLSAFDWRRQPTLSHINRFSSKWPTGGSRSPSAPRRRKIDSYTSPDPWRVGEWGLESGDRDGRLSFRILSTVRTAVETSCQSLYAIPAR